MILLDTSALIDCLCGNKTAATAVRRALAGGERIVLATLVLYEWLRGPRTIEEVAAQEALFPADGAIVFGPEEAERAATLYHVVPRARGREVDIAIAACALVWEATLWTRNVDDFRDIPGLAVSQPS